MKIRGGFLEKILVSACLLGEAVRYDGGSADCGDALLARWLAEGRLVSFCPEMAGGLPSPRPPAEIEAGATAADVLDGTAHVVTVEGADVTGPYLHGARAALDAARRHGCRVAILKDDSPSCGTTRIHDGTFSGRTIPGQGVTTVLLQNAGIAVFSERDIEGAAAFLEGSQT